MSCRVERICGFSTQFKRNINPKPLEIATINSPTQPAIQSSFMQQYNQLFFSYLDKVIEHNTNALAQLKLSMRLDHMEQTLPAFLWKPGPGDP